jgi:F-type H+-transporting ATPase subunit beta
MTEMDNSGTVADMDRLAGKVIALRGAVVDARFDRGPPPEIGHALLADPEGERPVLAEVQSQLDGQTVRAVALGSTLCLRRGTEVEAQGGPLRVPVGDAVLGRLLDIAGEPDDDGPPLPKDVPRRPIHRPAPRRSMCRRTISPTRRSPRFSPTSTAP